MPLEPAEAFNNYLRDNCEFITREGLRVPVFRGRQNLAELHRDFGAFQN